MTKRSYLSYVEYPVQPGPERGAQEHRRGSDARGDEDEEEHGAGTSLSHRDRHAKRRRRSGPDKNAGNSSNNTKDQGAGPQQGKLVVKNVPMPCDSGVRGRTSLQNLQIPFLKPNRITANSCMLVIGPRNSGKTCVIFSLMRSHRIAKYFAFSGTAFRSNSPFKALPPGCVEDGFNEKVLQALLDTQQKAVNKSGLNFETMTPREIERAMEKVGLCIVLDDVTHDGSVWNSPALKQMMFNGKHMGIKIIVSVHFATAINYRIRDQFEYVLATKEVKRENQKKLWSYFFGCVPTEAAFVDLFKKVAMDHRVIVCLSTAQSYDIDKNLAWFKGQYPIDDSSLFGKRAFSKAKIPSRPK